MNDALIQKAYAILGDLTPLKTDCGALCGAACCQSDVDGQGGVALLPPEQARLSQVDWAQMGRDCAMDAPMLLCRAACDRELRPYLCRIFPLCPVQRPDGRWTVRMDARARAVCPLARSGLKGLDPDFVRAAARSAAALAQDPKGEAFLMRWAQIEAQFRKPLF